MIQRDKNTKYIVPAHNHKRKFTNEGNTVNQNTVVRIIHTYNTVEPLYSGQRWEMKFWPL